MQQVKLSAIVSRRDMVGFEKILIYPSRERVFDFKKKIKGVIKKSYNLSAMELVIKLNPIIRRWCNYFDYNLSAKILSRLDNYVYKRL